MSQRSRRACLALALALGLTVAVPQAARAEPPGRDNFAPVALDTITPFVFLARQQCPYLQKQPPARSAGQLEMDPDGVLANLEKLTKARDLYRMAEYYHRLGHRETAVLYYQEAHLACPNCRYGMLAMRQLSRLDADRAEAAAEEQETPDVTRPGWDAALRALGCCADLAFGQTTRFLCEIPVGTVRIRVEYNGNAAVRVP